MARAARHRFPFIAVWIGGAALTGSGCGPTTTHACDELVTCPPDAGLADGADAIVISVPDATLDGSGADSEQEATVDAMAAQDAADVSDAFDGFDGFVCPASAEPKDQPCVIDETYGVFVSLNGSVSGAGTRASPLRAIDAAITLAVAESDAGVPKRVYVCGGTYHEAIAIGASRNRVQVFGGLDCGTWSYTGAKTALAPSAPGVVLTLTSLTSALFVDLEIDAADAPAAPPMTASTSGASSVAIVANGASGVEFRRTKIVAGKGQAGADGALEPYTFPTAAMLRGNAADGGAGGLLKTVVCPDGTTTTGGPGGTAPAGGGGAGLPALDGGAGGTSVECTNNITGRNGAPGLASANGPGATLLGALDAGLWQPAAGAAGTSGGPGQGGGGGGAVDPGGGGSGGAGGCGGAGGGPGGGGGASIAVVSVSSGLTFTDATLVSAAAAHGGAGASGQVGETPGGAGGSNDQISGFGCPGGRGGAGGSGGAGGGGAGGISAGILFSGTAPTVDAMTTGLFVQGVAGAAGIGGAAGTNDGVAGTTGLAVTSP